MIERVRLLSIFVFTEVWTCQDLILVIRYRTCDLPFSSGLDLDWLNKTLLNKKVRLSKGR